MSNLTPDAYFIEACKADAWKRRLWRNAIFTVTRIDTLKEDILPYDLDYRKDGTYYYKDEQWHLIDNLEPYTPLCMPRKTINLKPDDLPLKDVPKQSTYGRVLFNWLVIYYPFRGKLPFLSKTSTPEIVSMFVSKTVDEDEDVDNPNVFRPSEIQRFVTAVYELPSLTPYIAPTGSAKTLTTHPDMIKTRDKFLKEHENQLHDPAVVASFQKKLIDLDKEWLKGDSAMDYYLGSKPFNIERKNMFIMHGIEGSFQEDGKYTIIPESLQEGWNLKKNLVGKFNAIREGSFDRGHDTALGGEKVTFLQRIFQNAMVVPGDCGSKIKSRVTLTKQNYDMYIGMNMIVGSKLVVIEEEFAKANIGKSILIRRPATCLSDRMHFCAACCGPRWLKDPMKITSDCSAPGSIIMGAYMSSMHGSELAVEEYDFEVELG